MWLDRKKISASGLMLLVAIPLLFSAAVLIKQKVIQYQRNERFAEEILHTITVSAENIYWVKPGKEILFEGKLFDVKSFKTENNRISLTGFFDDKEDKLVQQIVKLEQQKDKSGSPYSQLTIKFLFFPIYNSHSEIKVEDFRTLTTHKFYSFTERIPEAPYNSFTPPPKS